MTTSSHLALGLALLVQLVACGSPAPPPAPRTADELDGELVPPAGCGSDENEQTFDDLETTKMVIVDDARAPLFTTPISGATLPGAAPPMFVWQPTPTEVGKPHGTVSCSECTVCHLPPVSGDVFDVQFSIGGTVVYRIVYTSQQWSPPAALWSSWRGQKVSIASWRMTLKVNDLADGPFTASAPVTFQVSP